MLQESGFANELTLFNTSGYINQPISVPGDELQRRAHTPSDCACLPNMLMTVAILQTAVEYFSFMPCCPSLPGTENDQQNSTVDAGSL